MKCKWKMLTRMTVKLGSSKNRSYLSEKCEVIKICIPRKYISCFLLSNGNQVTNESQYRENSKSHRRVRKL